MLENDEVDAQPRARLLWAVLNEVQYPLYSFITNDNTPDRLRWYRYQRGLLQADVAAYVGIDRVTYSRYEEGIHEYYPIEIMDKIAELFEVPVTALLDEYCF